ncbi:MAG: DUF928 domain-containing protein [Cyanobacteria bacterium P01_D01_bin.73]
MAHLTPLCSRSASTLAIALLSATGGGILSTSVILSANAQEFAPTLAQVPGQEFSPPRDIGTPGRREPAGTRFSPPRDIGTPGRREPAGTRGTRCSRLLLPTFRNQQSAVVTSYGYGKTVSDRPKLYLYLDSGSQEINLRVSLFSEDRDEAIAVVRKRYQGEGGIYEVDLFDEAQSPDGQPLSLEAGKTYTLRSEVACADPVTQDWSYSVETGIIQRLATDTAFERQIEGLSTPLERVNFYAQEGLWVDFMNQVADASREGGDRTQLVAAWTQILKKLQSDFVGTGEAPGEASVTELFFENLLNRDLVVIEPKS